jgi:hypothetical protein
MKSEFERGWGDAIAQWDNGITWEVLTLNTNPDDPYDQGLRAAVDYMSGWQSCAAKLYGLKPENLPQPRK